MNPNSTSTSPLSGTGLSADAISRRAYELWEAEGRPDGCDMRHWLQAEQELNTPRETTTTTTHAAGNGAPQNGAAAASTNTDVRPLQGTRAAAAAARDPKRSTAAQPPTEKTAATASTMATGRRK